MQPQLLFTLVNIPMIRFSLQCLENHRFESWFASNAAFEDLKKRALISCPICGSLQVEKALMAPSLGHKTATPPPPASQKPVADPADQTAKMIDALRREVEKNSEYVGNDFAHEARRIHHGQSPERAIYGEAKPQEARALIEEGVHIAPLPFIPKKNTN